MLSRIFKAVRGTKQVAVNKIIRIAAITGMDTRLRRRLDEDVGRTRAGKIVHAANISVHKYNATRVQARKRKLAATALEIIEGNYSRGRPVAFKRKCEIGADKAGPSGNEDALGHDG
jgi:hypothetical protein